MYRYARLLLDPGILRGLRQRYPLYLVVEQLHRHANPLFEHHLVEHLLRQSWLYLLFLRDLHGHANTLLKSHLQHVRSESWLLLLLFHLRGHPHRVQPAIHDHLLLESRLLPRSIGKSGEYRRAKSDGTHAIPYFIPDYAT